MLHHGEKDSYRMTTWGQSIPVPAMPPHGRLSEEEPTKSNGKLTTGRGFRFAADSGLAMTRRQADSPSDLVATSESG
jgi:hypothetical protein